MEQDTQQPTLRDYIRVVTAQRTLVVLVVFVAAGAALVASARQDSVYSATATLSISDESEDLGLLGTPTFATRSPEQASAELVDTVTREEVLARVRRALGFAGSVDTLRTRINATVEAQSNLVAVSAQSGSGRGAARLANEVARQTRIVAQDRARRNYRSIALSLRRSFKDLTGNSRDPAVRGVYVDRISRVESLARFSKPVDVVSTAKAPGIPISPKPVRNTVVAGIMGLFIGIALAFARNALDRRVRDPREVARELDYPILGHVRDEAMGKVPFTENGRGELDVEAFRILRANLDFLRPGGPVRTVAVASGLPEEGKSTVAASLALSNAAAGRSTLLVECDLRRPTLAGRLGIDGSPGLTDYLVGQAGPQDVVQVVKPPEVDGEEAGQMGGRALACITAGSPSPRPAELLGSQLFRDFIAQVGSAYEVVVLDTSPLLSVADTRELLPYVDGVLLCVRVARTTRDQVAAVKEALSHLPDAPVGLVMTGVSGKDQRDYAYYSYGYGYGST